jgi:hypothetical protein
MANPIKLHHKKQKGPSWNKVVPHHILLSKGERIGVRDLRAFIGNKIGVFPWYNVHFVSKLEIHISKVLKHTISLILNSSKDHI